MVAKIKTPKKFDKLFFLVFITIVVSAILKTIVFVHSFDIVMILIYNSYNLLFKYIKNDEKKIIRIFTLILKSDAKKNYLEDFCNGNTRI